MEGGGLPSQSVSWGLGVGVCLSVCQRWMCAPAPVHAARGFPTRQRPVVAENYCSV